MRLHIALWVLLAALAPLPAAAQDGLGLDLSDESKKPPDEQKPAAESPTEAPADTPAEPPPPEAPAPSESAKAAAAAAQSKLLTEADIASEDRVKAVQRKAFLKKGRFELTPQAFLTVNDAFFPKFGPAGRLAYYPHDNLGVALSASQYNLVPSNNIRLAKRQLHSRLPSVRPNAAFALDLLWSPFYGKVSLFNSIKHFDLYVLGGAAALLTQTSNEDGLHLGTNLGLGQRFAVTDYLTVDLSIVETLYADRPDAGNKAIVQHLLSVNGGVSIFFPFTFDYREH